MSNFCQRRARQIVADEVQKFIVKGDLRRTPESIKRAKAAADAALRDSPLEYEAVVELREDQRGVIVDVEERR